MIKQLVQVASRFHKEGKLPPTGYKLKTPKWIVNLEGGRVHLEGPYTRDNIRQFPAPDRQRSGKPSPDNLKPFLLLDDARYALGKPEEGKEKEAQLLHSGFVALLRHAYQATGVQELSAILNFLTSNAVQDIREKVEPKDLIAFRVDGKDLTELAEVQDFWSHYLSGEILTGNVAECGICGKPNGVVRILPREIVVLGQKCQVSSFNKTAFLSFGKEQTANAPICFTCASRAVDALDYLIRTERHRRTLWFSPEGSSLENQLAVYWLNHETEAKVGEEILNIEDLLGAVIDDGSRSSSPPVELSQVQALLSVPWTGDQTAVSIDEASFYLAVLSANKGRLVIREWVEAELGRVKRNLKAFLEATRMVSVRGEPARPLSIGAILQALAVANPNLVRGLVRTAYLGERPPQGLWAAAVKAFRNPNILQDPREGWRLQALASVLKLSLFHGKEEVERMSTLNRDYRSRAYLCGRLLAILEEAQLRASGFNLNRTLVDRFYGAASTAPGVTFGSLIRLATTAHLPEVGKEVNLLMEEVMSSLDDAGGFPNTLTLAEQAEFGLGFYHQRAAFRANRGKNKNEGGQS